MVLCVCLLVRMDWACPLKDVLCTCPLSLLILRSGVLNRTLSHIWWRLYLPTFLLSVGLLTLMYIDSLIVLARPWSSFPIMVKFSGLVLCPVWVLCAWMGWRFFQVFLVSFSKGPGCLLYVFLIEHELPTLIPVDAPTFLALWQNA